MLIEPSFRTITNRLILLNLENLIKCDYNNLIDNHCDILNKIYYTYISNIKMIIINNKYVREKGFELFENEWTNYISDIDIVIKRLISKPFLILPFNIEDVLEGK